MITTESLEQEVLHNNKEIFSRIVQELEGADFEILIASAWFTDDELYQVVLKKASQNIRVEVIIADNQENLKLDFATLIAKGASVTKIKSGGYRMMRQKFCVIDKRVALHGSYSWSINARKNNQESMIVTNHPETVNSLIHNFKDIQKKAIEGKDVVETPQEQLPVSAEATIEKHSAREHAVLEFTKVLDAMIAAEIGNFDRSMLRKQGYDRSKSNNGNPQVLTKALDTVYSVFINEIDVVDDKKRRLITKIDEQKQISINAFVETLNLQLHTAESDARIDTLNVNNKLISLDSELEKNKKDIEGIQVNKIGIHKIIISSLREKIRIAQREFVVPKFKWYEFIPVLIANLFLFAYIVIFYSSAGYLLLFSVADAKEAIKDGLEVVQPEIFNSDALRLSMAKSGTGIFFILLFVIIPLCSAIIKVFTKNRWLIAIMLIVGIVFVDTAIAYRVSASMYQTKILIGDVTEPWNIKMAFSDPDFYLVFLLGGFGLLMFKFAFQKLISIFEERNPDVNTLKNDLLIKQMTEDIDAEETKIIVLNDEILLLENANIDLLAQKQVTERLLECIPSKLTHLQEMKKIDLISGRKYIEDISAIYKSHIENDNLPISVTSLKDRINVFLEGWNDYLYEEYANNKATEKAKEAFDTAVNWQSEKIKTNQIDKRIIVS